MKTIIAILYAKLIRKRNQNWITNPIKYQNKTFHKLISKSKKTKFGTDHGFSEILSYFRFVFSEGVGTVSLAWPWRREQATPLAPPATPTSVATWREVSVSELT